jgi:hypothetical protein
MIVGKGMGMSSSFFRFGSFGALSLLPFVFFFLTDYSGIRTSVVVSSG